MKQAELDALMAYLRDMSASVTALSETVAAVAKAQAEFNSTLARLTCELDTVAVRVDSIDLTPPAVDLSGPTTAIENLAAQFNTHAGVVSARFDIMAESMEELRTATEVSARASEIGVTEAVQAVTLRVEQLAGELVDTREGMQASTQIIADNLAARVDDATVALSKSVNDVFPYVNDAIAKVKDDMVSVARREAAELDLAYVPPPPPPPQQIDEAALLDKALAEVREKLAAVVPDIVFNQYIEEKTGMLVIAMDTTDKDGELVTYENKFALDIGVRYRAVYSKDTKYAAGDMVTHDGSMWLCNGAPTGAPGKDFTGWRLIVKRGANGKDGFTSTVYTCHVAGQKYQPTDFLRIHNRLWQSVCTNEDPPGVTQVSSDNQWLLIGGVQ